MNKKAKFSIASSVSLVLLAFFLPWVKLVDITSMFTGGRIMEMNAYKIITYAIDLNDLYSSYFGEVLWQLYTLYLYVLIPILTVLTLAFAITKKDRIFRNLSILTASVAIVLCIAPIVVLNTETDAREILSKITKVGIGYYLTLVGSVMVFLINFAGNKVFKLKFNKDNKIIKVSIDMLDKLQLVDKINTLKDTSSKMIASSGKELSSNSGLQLGYLGFGGVLMIMTIVSLIKQDWSQLTYSLTLMVICGASYLFIPATLTDDVKIELEKTFDQLGNLLSVIGFKDSIVGVIEKSIYLIIFVQVANVFINANTLLYIINILAAYFLFISVMFLLTKGRVRLAYHGVVGYTVILFLSVVVNIFKYKFVGLDTSLSLLIFWTISWHLNAYMHNYEGKNKYEEKDKQLLIEDL